MKRSIGTEYVTASDTDAARALRVSRAAISAYKAGRDVMSPDTLERAQEILKLPPAELFDYSLALLSEASPQTRAVWAAHEWMREQARRFEGFKGGAAAIAIAIACAGLVFPSNPASGEPSSHGHMNDYAKCAVQQRRRRVRRVADWRSRLGSLAAA